MFYSSWCPSLPPRLLPPTAADSLTSASTCCSPIKVFLTPSMGGCFLRGRNERAWQFRCLGGRSHNNASIHEWFKKTNDESSVGIHGGKDAWEDNELQTKLKIANIRHSISECTLGSLMKCPLLAIRVSRWQTDYITHKWVCALKTNVTSSAVLPTTCYVRILFWMLAAWFVITCSVSWAPHLHMVTTTRRMPGWSRLVVIATPRAGWLAPRCDNTCLTLALSCC